MEGRNRSKQAASKYVRSFSQPNTHWKALDEIYQIYTRLYSFEPYEFNLKTTKTASARRPLGEKRCIGKEEIRPQRCSGAWRKKMKNVQKALRAVGASENCTDSKR